MLKSEPVLAVHLLLRRGEKYLLLERADTGWMDGYFSVIAGHVELGESALEAVCREAMEEAGLEISPAELDLVHTMHRLAEHERLDLFFAASSWRGEPQNREPHKCAGLGWFAKSALPERMVPYVAQALGAWALGQRYSEHGF